MESELNKMQQDQFKLLIENALLEQEKRLGIEFRKELKQHTDDIARLVDGHTTKMLTLATQVGKLEVKVTDLKTRIWTISTVSAGIGGAIVFLLDRTVLR